MNIYGVWSTDIDGNHGEWEISTDGLPWTGNYIEAVILAKILKVKNTPRAFTVLVYKDFNNNDQHGTRDGGNQTCCGE